MTIKLELPKVTELRPRITVIGVGGAGCNAVNNMIAAGLSGVDFVVANTDAQALAASSAEHRVQLGANLTEGLGAGAKPEIGEAAAEEAIEDIRAQVAGAHMVFIAGGMGGGTGTGAAAVIARAAKELGVLTVGIVTKPFQFEGARRARIADAGIIELKKYVDTLIVIPNQNLFRIANEKTTFAEAFVLADQVLYSGVACIVDLIVKEGLINLDFADVRTVMSGMGTAMMGTGEASGERRAIIAAEEAIANPLLDDVTLKGAKGLLLSITGGPNLTLYEVDEAASRVRQEVDPDANIIVGATFDDILGDRVRVSIVASGMTRAGEALKPATSEFWPRAMKAAAPAPAPTQPAESVSPRAATQSAQRESEDVQRRLSEALQYGVSAQGFGAPPAQAASEARVAPRPKEGWRAPGNVLIEDSLSTYARDPQQPPPLPDSFGRPPGPPPAAFTPAPPADVRRSQRRMPDVADFPPIAQKEYRAKTSPSSDMARDGGRDAGRSAAETEWRPEPEPRKRFSLFDRLRRRGRRDDDSTNEGHDDNVTWTEADSRSESAYGSIRARNTADRPGGMAGRSREQAELPEFFSSKRK